MVLALAEMAAKDLELLIFRMEAGGILVLFFWWFCCLFNYIILFGLTIYDSLHFFFLSFLLANPRQDLQPTSTFQGRSPDGVSGAWE